MSEFPQKMSLPAIKKIWTCEEQLTGTYWMLCGKLSEFYKNTIYFGKTFYHSKTNASSKKLEESKPLGIESWVT